MARGFNYAPGSSPEIEQARDPHLHKTQVMVLAESRNAVVREEIARRPDLPLGVVVSLAHDRVPDVRAALAANPSASTSVLEHLSSDKQPAVLLALITNPALTSDVVERLAFHKRPEVRAAAAARLSTDEAGEEADDHATPELRDRVVLGFPDGAPLTGTTGPSLHDPRPTRTAPVRGFRPPDQT